MGKLDLADAAYVSEEIDRQLTRTRVQPGDVLLNITGASIGRVASFNVKHTRANVNQHVCVIRPKPDRLSSEFLSRYIAVPWFQDHINRIQAGGTRQALNFSQIAEFEVPLPPLEEQRRIAEILSQAEALRAKRCQALAKLDTLNQSLFLEMFGDPLANPRGWTIVNLGDLIVDGPQNGLYKPASDYGSGVPILRIDSFYDGEVTDFRQLKRVRLSERETETYLLRDQDIVVNRVNSREYLGKSALITGMLEPTVFESNMMRFRVNNHRVEARFLVALLQNVLYKGSDFATL